VTTAPLECAASVGAPTLEDAAAIVGIAVTEFAKRLEPDPHQVGIGGRARRSTRTRARAATENAFSSAKVTNAAS